MTKEFLTVSGPAYLHRVNRLATWLLFLLTSPANYPIILYVNFICKGEEPE